jgi:hypothetical protein
MSFIGIGGFADYSDLKSLWAAAKIVYSADRLQGNPQPRSDDTISEQHMVHKGPRTLNG